MSCVFFSGFLRLVFCFGVVFGLLFYFGSYFVCVVLCIFCGLFGRLCRVCFVVRVCWGFVGGHAVFLQYAFVGVCGRSCRVFAVRVCWSFVGVCAVFLRYAFVCFVVVICQL